MPKPKSQRKSKSKSPTPATEEPVGSTSQTTPAPDHDGSVTSTASTSGSSGPKGRKGGRRGRKSKSKKSKSKSPKPKAVIDMPERTYKEELAFINEDPDQPGRFKVDIGFVPNMLVPGYFYVNAKLQSLMFDELKQYVAKRNSGAFLPAVKQLCNVASLPGIVQASVALPDCHSGYGFSIGNVAAFDCDDPKAVVSPGGVGFDINCGVRLIRTNLTREQIIPVQEQLVQTLFDHIPVGVGSKGVLPTTEAELNDALETGVDWCIKKGYATPADKTHCEEQGRMLSADPSKVSVKAKRRGLPQLGTLGAGNHYCEVQFVDEIFNPKAAKAMGLFKDQCVIMLHCGSRGLGHQVATDALVDMEKELSRTNTTLNDRQLACAPIQSEAGQNYIKAMSAAANYAWVNRQCITYLVRKAFTKVFGKSPSQLEMIVVYDTSHNIAKFEKHTVGGEIKNLLVHRKGSTRAFPPHHPQIPADYHQIGQPALIGGTMGTASYVLTGTKKGMLETFGSTCHGAGRAMSRSASRRQLDHRQILDDLKAKGISIRVASPKLITEEAPESYKDVDSVVDTCHDCGITLKAVKLKPMCVVKG